MPDQQYIWKRFWCPREGKISLLDDGYLYDPEERWASIYNPDVVPFEAISGVPCLVLLGEPGIGKTHAMEDEQEAIREKAASEGDRVIFKSLRSYSNEERLIHDIFESEEFTSWLNSNYTLHLFLDSLDECLLQIKTVAMLLADKLAEYPVDRLCLRIACRTADWPVQLESDLKKLWNEEAVGVYELVPLRKADVAEAAKVNQLDPNEFLDEVRRVGAVPLAIKPVTLKFLLSSYRRNKQLPSKKEELYYEGCLRLCEEYSTNRSSAGHTGELDREHRLVIAARIAAVTVFANRYAVWVGDDCDAPEEDIVAADLAIGKEYISGQEITVTTAAVKEVLSTGLFSSRGEHQLGWSHQSYAEFLSAWYLKHHDVTLPQIISLIVHPDDREGRLAPQLYEADAWLAGMRVDVLKEIARRDPEVLLRSDMALANDYDKAALVESFLHLYEAEKLLDPWSGHDDGYHNLAYPGLADQLRPYIQDSERVFAARVVAIKIAEACEVSELQDALVNLTLNSAENITLRAQAANAISIIGDTAARAQLKPIVGSDIENDPDDELKGNLLGALWPGQITVQELFTFLTPPKKRSLVGTYKYFILNDIVANLGESDLPIALSWIEERESKRNSSHSLDTLIDQLMLKAWEGLGVPDVLHGFAKAALARLKSDREIADRNSALTKAVEDNDINRHAVIKEMIQIALTASLDIDSFASWLVWSPIPIVMSKDLTWLVEQLQQVDVEEEERILTALIRKLFDPRDSEHMSAAYSVYKTKPCLKEAFDDIFQPVKLGSPEAEKMRAIYLEDERRRERMRRPPIKPSPSERILKSLDEFESGDINAWLRVIQAMALEPDGRTPVGWSESDLTVFPGWSEADMAVKVRIVEAAKQYILEGSPNTDAWLGTNSIKYTAIAGYTAIRLLHAKEPGFVSELSVETWQKWASTIIAYPISSGPDGREPHDLLLRSAYQKAPSEIIKAATILIDRDNKGGQSYLFVLHRLEACWDDCLAGALLAKAKDKKLKPECMGQLLSELLKRSEKDTRTFAESLIAIPIPKEPDKRGRAIKAASALIINTEDAAWPAVWPAILQDSEFGQAVFQIVASDLTHRTPTIGKLSNSELADLFIWLTKMFPEANDNDSEDDDMAGWVGPIGNIGMLRDSILRRLQDSGTDEACKEIERIAQELPELTWLKWTLLRARDNTRRNSWNPPQPQEIIELAESRDRRLVQNGDQLLDAVIESLKRLEVALQDETPASPDLWNEVETGEFKPKEEEAFSDYVKRHLDRELTNRAIIFNREVTIRRVAEGERTDIHVDAVTPGEQADTYRLLKVIIEVKGCWNQYLDTDMEEQLAKRYLKDNQCDHGLYLIGAYYCDKWHDKDYKKGRCRNNIKEDAQAYFESKAATLSKQEGKRIKAMIINTALR